MASGKESFKTTRKQMNLPVKSSMGDIWLCVHLTLIVRLLVNLHFFGACCIYEEGMMFSVLQGEVSVEETVTCVP